MVMPYVTLEMASISKLEDLPTCSPNLLPFSVNYTGPAPVSTYFRVERTSSQVAVPALDEKIAPLESEKAVESVASSSKVVDEGAPTSDVGTETLDEVTGVSADIPDIRVDAALGEPTLPAGLLESATDTPVRFVASFRGRIVQGMSVGLPEGYAGIVLKADGTGVAVNEKGKGKEKATKGRVTRRSSARAKATEDVEMEVDEGDTMHGDQGHEQESDSRMTRILQPVSTFSSFVLLHPDIPVDEGKDEYLRSLSEWTRLSAEVCFLFSQPKPGVSDVFIRKIHQVDEC